MRERRLNTSRCLLEETNNVFLKTPFAFYSISLSMQTKRKTKGNNEILRAFKRLRTQRVRPDIARNPTRFASSKVPGKKEIYKHIYIYFEENSKTVLNICQFSRVDDKLSLKFYDIFDMELIDVEIIVK